MAPAELAAWLRLLETPGVGRETARRLLAAFGPPEAVFAASRAAHRELLGPALADTLSRPPDTLPALLDATAAWLATDDGVARRLVALGDPDYPALLLETADPPLLLYAQGRAELLSAEGIAVVGSRNPTPQGRDHARQFATALSQAGLTVVSGLALGIDGEAHAGALEGPGRTIAVVGTGLDRVYPRAHRALAHRLSREGLLLSEYPLGTPPMPAHFPQRNRIIAGLTRGTLVVEAALQSGSLITARLATEAGREVFAIPGSIQSPQARGCHALLRQGAQLVESAADILGELKPAGWAPAATALAAADGEAEEPLLAALGHDPVTLDALQARTGWPAGELNARLLDLELAGQVARLPGQLFQRRVPA